MALTGLITSAASRIFSSLGKGCSIQQTRTKFANARQLRDYNRRMVAKEWAPTCLRLLSIKRNDILPPEIRRIADKEMYYDVPRRAHMSHLHPRCVITGRPRGQVLRWRLSRFVFRHLVDYNQMAGVQRAMWG